MQKGSSSEIAREIINSAKAVLDEKMSNIRLYNVTEEPYKMFSLKCVVYEYFVLVFNYDRGHFGCSISCGDDAIPLPNDIEWNDQCDFMLLWENIDKQVSLRIPDKFLIAKGWL